jgi:hypothetical protein
LSCEFDNLLLMSLVPQNADDEGWYCHCCAAKNVRNVKKCRVCGRPESYAQPGYPLPFHGKNAKLYRPSQLLAVLDDIHVVDSEKWTSLHTACANGNLDMVKELLKYKAQVEALTNKGQTPMHLAVYSGSIDCVQELLRHGASVNVETFHEKTSPLHIAAEKGFARIAQLLLQSGANVNALNILERTPLHCAAISGRTDVGLLLLNAGARLHAFDVHSWEPGQIAELYNHRPFQELLVRHGMTEKQSVLKDLPLQKWHNDVWFEVVRMQTKRREDYRRTQEQLADEERRLEWIKEQARTEERKKRLEERKLAKKFNY